MSATWLSLEGCGVSGPQSQSVSQGQVACCWLLLAGSAHALQCLWTGVELSISRHLWCLCPFIGCALPLGYLVGEKRQSQDYRQRDFQMETLIVTQSFLPILASCLSISQWERGVSDPAEEETLFPGHLLAELLIYLSCSLCWCWVCLILL